MRHGQDAVAGTVELASNRGGGIAVAVVVGSQAHGIFKAACRAGCIHANGQRFVAGPAFAQLPENFCTGGRIPQQFQRSAEKPHRAGVVYGAAIRMQVFGQPSTGSCVSAPAASPSAIASSGLNWSIRPMGAVGITAPQPLDWLMRPVIAPVAPARTADKQVFPGARDWPMAELRCNVALSASLLVRWMPGVWP